MEKYEDLIDVVSTIVRDYGGEILGKPKFWNVLSDSYRFSSDYSLRNAYKACLTEGYVDKIASLKEDKKSTVREIRDIVEGLKTKSYKEGEVAAVLFSVAIAVDTCSKKDYEDFFRPQIATSSTRHTKPSTNQARTQSMRQTEPYEPRVCHDRYLGILLSGLLAVGLGTLSYGLFLFKGWWLSFIVAFIGFMQIVWGWNVFESFKTPNSSAAQNKIALTSLPFSFAFFVNVIMSLGLHNYEVRRWAYYYWAHWQPTDMANLSIFGQFYGWNKIHNFPVFLMEHPSLFSTILGILVMIGSIGQMHEFFKRIVRGSQLKIKYCLLPLALILLVEGGIFAYGPIKQEIQETEFLRKKEKISEEYNRRVEKNHR